MFFYGVIGPLHFSHLPLLGFIYQLACYTGVAPLISLLHFRQQPIAKPAVSGCYLILLIQGAK